MKALAHIRSFCLFLFLLAPALRAETIVLLCNKDIALGRDLARQYADFYQLSGNVIVEIPMPLTEAITLDEYQNKVRAPLKKILEEKFGAAPPEMLLSFYGVPLLVQDKQRWRSVDQLLALLYWDGHTRDNVVSNPCFLKAGIVAGQPLRVCRLDAPNPKYAQRLLQNWISAAHFGPWRRYLVGPDEKSLRFIFEKSDLSVHDSSSFKKFPPREIQYLQASSTQLAALVARGDASRFNHGALVLKTSDIGEMSGPFRSLGHCDASAAILAGAGFYVGSHKRMHEFEDLFNHEHFFERFLAGENFASAVYGAMPNLAGSLLVIGDPLFRPHHPNALAEYEKTFLLTQLPTEDKNYIALFTMAKDWWLLREGIKDWQDERLDMAMGKLKGAHLLRSHTAIYAEQLLDYYTRLDEREEINKLLQGLSKRKLPPYYEELFKSAGMKKS